MSRMPGMVHMDHSCILYIVMFLTCLFWPECSCRENRIRPTCPREAAICEVWLELEWKMTMMVYPEGSTGMMSPVEIKPGGGGFIVKDKHCQQEEDSFLPDNMVEDVVVGDGKAFQMVCTVNGTTPGPPIVVYKGQQVVVHVKNSMENEATSMHFHGIHQWLTPWMDGVGGVTQCPINPGESFTHRFLAYPSGTHWYHSHVGTQRTMGIYGPFIVLDSSPEDTNNNRRDDPLPDVDDEFYLMVHDWMRRDSHDISTDVKYEIVSYAYGYDKDYCFNSTKQSDGVDSGVIPFHSATINGRGRHYGFDRDTLENPYIPLEVFEVEKGKKYRFRVIGTGMTFAFRVSVDGHPLHIVATDGHDVRTTIVESVIVFPGERYDFWVQATDPLNNNGTYWIRAETLERLQMGKPIKPGHVEAILKYSLSQDGEPSTLRRNCSAEEPCVVLNCPYRYELDEKHIICVPVSHLKLAKESTTLSPGDASVKVKKNDDSYSQNDDIRQSAIRLGESNNDEPYSGFVEHFLNFHFTGMKTRGSWKPTINGISNILPATPPQLNPYGTWSPNMCNNTSCEDDFCECSHVLKVPLGAIVQLNLIVTVKNPPGVLNGNTHPVHLHGHSFQVIKTGWPLYDPITKYYQKENSDFVCVHKYCNVIGWRNSSWQNGNIPDVTTQRAPLKDTVIVPVGGYVIARFKAEKPGFWYLHCHTEFHNDEGMALILQVGEPGDMNAPPSHMRTCQDFTWSHQEFMMALINPVSPEAVGSSPGGATQWGVLQFMTIGLAATCLFFLFFIISMKCYRNRGYTYVTPSNSLSSSSTPLVSR